MNSSDSEDVSDHDSDSDGKYSDILDGLQEREKEQQEDESTSHAESSNIAESKISSSTSATSLLEILRAPRPSDLARKRKVQCNPGKQKKTKSSSINSEPKGVKLHDRVRKYPNEFLSVSHGKLFCTACREELSLKSLSPTNHLKSQKHKEGKERLKRKEARERDIASKITSYNEETRVVGENIAESTQVFHVKVVSAFLRAGVPLNKLEVFRELFEETEYRLTDRRNMHDLIPFIHKQEFEKIREEINGKDISVIFDGTTCLGEALAIVKRYVNAEWKIVQWLVRLQIMVRVLLVRS